MFLSVHLQIAAHSSSTSAHSDYILTNDLQLTVLDFRDKRDLKGERLQQALWLGEMELKRLQAWEPTGKQMTEGKDLDVKL